jgi:hypothetical protein
LSALLLSFGLNHSSGQNIGKILSPLPNDTLLNGELFIVVEADTSLNIKPSKLNLTIDKLNYSTLIKYSGNMITALVMNPIKPGEHEIELKLYQDEGEYLSQKWTFCVFAESKMKHKYPEQYKELNRDKKNFEIKGSLSLSSKITDLSGNGAFLRQEPPQSQQVRADGTMSYRKLEFPFKFYYTNHENPLSPPRNRMMIGIKGKKAGIFLGDVNPSYDMLLLSGSRIRGAEGFVRIRNTKFSATHGEVNRKIEGKMEYWDIYQGFPPINMQKDSSYVIPGKYKRNLSAFNLEISPPNSGNKFRFTCVRSTDDVASIRFGGPAEQNIAGSINTIVEGRNKRFRADVGVAVSATTKDIRRGAVSPEEFSSTYKEELRVNPKGWENIFIVNSTTVPLTTKNATFLGMYANFHLNILKQHITIKLQRLGSTFESFGNPYLQNDRRNVSFQDQIPIWKNRISFMLQYRYNEDNLSKIKATTNTMQMAGASLTLITGNKAPRITGGYRIFLREGITVAKPELVNDTRITNYNAGINYNLTTRGFTHGLNVVFNRNIHEIHSPRISSDVNDVVNFCFTESLHEIFLLSVQYNHLLLASETSNLTEQQTIGLRLSYCTKNKKFRISAGGSQISSEATELSSESSRQMLSADGQYQFFKNATIKLQLGNSTYAEPGTAGNNFNELWGQVTLKYEFK